MSQICIAAHQIQSCCYHPINGCRICIGNNAAKQCCNSNNSNKNTNSSNTNTNNIAIKNNNTNTVNSVPSTLDEYLQRYLGQYNTNTNTTNIHTNTLQSESINPINQSNPNNITVIDSPAIIQSIISNNNQLQPSTASLTLQSQYRQLWSEYESGLQIINNIKPNQIKQSQQPQLQPQPQSQPQPQIQPQPQPQLNNIPSSTTTSSTTQFYNYFSPQRSSISVPREPAVSASASVSASISVPIVSESNTDAAIPTNPLLSASLFIDDSPIKSSSESITASSAVQSSLSQSVSVSPIEQSDNSDSISSDNSSVSLSISSPAELDPDSDTESEIQSKSQSPILHHHQHQQHYSTNLNDSLLTESEFDPNITL